MYKNCKKILILILGFIILIAVIALIKNIAQTENYMSDDPLFGSFSIENKKPSDIIYPADFLISIDVPTTYEKLVECGKKYNVDILEGSWVYSFEEDKIFRAVKEDNKLYVYEDDKVIGTFEYSSEKFLWIDYNESYRAIWRNSELDLIKTLQGFVFP